MPKMTLPTASPDTPPTFWGRVLSLTPVIMTVVATLLAGLSNSEMTQSQYFRTRAAEVQSKAGDQWGFFQAKKLRALETKNTRDILLGTADVGVFDPAALGAAVKEILAQLEHAAPQAPATMGGDLALPPDVLAALDGAAVAEPAPWQPHDSTVKQAADAFAAGAPEAQTAPLIAQLKDEALTEEICSAASYANEMDAKSGPTGHVIDRVEAVLVKVLRVARATGDAAVQTRVLRWYNGFNVARLGYVSQRYDIEARHNQALGALYEVQVRLESAHSDRHRARSQRFFFGMLGAQAAVVAATLALAAKQRNLLWSFAAAVGLAAVAFAIYVYLYV